MIVLRWRIFRLNIKSCPLFETSNRCFPGLFLCVKILIRIKLCLIVQLSVITSCVHRWVALQPTSGGLVLWSVFIDVCATVQVIVTYLCQDRRQCARRTSGPHQCESLGILIDVKSINIIWGKLSWVKGGGGGQTVVKLYIYNAKWY